MQYELVEQDEVNSYYMPGTLRDYYFIKKIKETGMHKFTWKHICNLQSDEI